jgi:MoxR-like ATPase
MNDSSIVITAQAGVPVLLISEPGTGKTAWLNAVASALDRHLETLIGSICDPTDIGGQPMRVNGHCEYAPPGWFVRLRDCKTKGRKGGMLFGDELTSCPPTVQAPLLRLYSERRLHCGELPADTLLFAACNPPEQAAAGHDLAPPMANRLAYFTWNPPATDWITGMVAGWPAPRVPLLPSNWEARLPAAKVLVASFIRANPTLLHVFPTDEAQRSGPWPSRRTWDLVARTLAAHDALSMAADDAVPALVGPGAVIAFLDWRRNQNLPDPEALLANPGTFVMPERDDIAFTVLNSVVGAALGRLTPPRWAAAWDILAVAVRAGLVDVAAIAARALAATLPLGVTKIPPAAAAFLPALQKAGILGR